MNEAIENVLEQPKPVKIGILAGTVGAILLGYFMLLHSDLVERESTLETDIAQKESEVAERKGIVANLPRYREEVELLDIELNKALKELPDKGEVHLLLSKISDKAQDSGLDIKIFKPSEEVKKEFYAEVPVEIEVDGTFHQVATFFDEVGNLERLVNLFDFSLIDPVADDAVSTIKTSVIAKAFRFLDESERPKPQEAKGKKSKRRKKK